MTFWSPIATAPKDGTLVLLFSPDAAEPQIFLGQWAEALGEGFWLDPWTCSEWPIDADPTFWARVAAAPFGDEDQADILDPRQRRAGGTADLLWRM